MLSGDVRKVSRYRTAGANARLRLFAFLTAPGVPASEADGLTAALEAGAESGVAELEGVASRGRRGVLGGGRGKGVITVSEALTQITDREGGAGWRPVGRSG